MAKEKLQTIIQFNKHNRYHFHERRSNSYYNKEDCWRQFCHHKVDKIPCNEEGIKHIDLDRFCCVWKQKGAKELTIQFRDLVVGRPILCFIPQSYHCI